jgi:uncharacterized protein
MAIPQSNTRPIRRKMLAAFEVNGTAIKKFLFAGYTWLKTNKEVTNSLNVFPVPDGDTGTNMLLTLQSAIDDIGLIYDEHAGDMLKAIANGTLMGARGNSGVILSQIWRGIANELENDPIVTVEAFVRSLENARDTAYRGVVKPVEGTILTVISDIAKAARKELPNAKNILDMIDVIVEAADISVQNTPNLLPVLKEAGVVDSGGKGLFFIFEGIQRLINREDLTQPIMQAVKLSSDKFDSSMEAVEEGQDYEVVVDFRPNDKFELKDFYTKLDEMGTSIQVGEGQNIFRMHIHVPTENLYTPIDYCLEQGVITNVAIENLMDQMEEIGQEAHIGYELHKVKRGEIAVVSVVPGEGFANIFASLGVAALVTGGQTMNPSTADILASFEDVPTNEIIILPNNSNIFMSAKSAAEMSVKKVHVIESRSPIQGISAMMRLSPTGEFENVIKDMESSLSDVETGEITVAVRDVEIDGVEVKEGNTIGLHNGKLVVSSESLEKGIMSLLDKIELDEYEIITAFHGNNITVSEVEELIGKVEEKYPEVEVDIQDGGQPHYQFIFSIE